MRVEFHVHTRFSNDSLLCIHVLALMCKIKRINCVAICDHNTILGAIAAQKVLPRFGVSVIAGEEIFTESGEIIGLYLRENVRASLSAKETVHEIRKQGGLVYVPHPYDLKRCKTVLKEEALLEIAQEIDFMEIHNGRNVEESYSQVQKEIFLKLKSNKIVPICGSDAHTFFEVGRNYMDCPNADCSNPASLKNAIGSAKMVAEKNQPLSHKITKIIKAVKLVFGGNIGELFRIIGRRCEKRNGKVGKKDRQ